MQDFIEGPCNDTIKTANFPVLAKIVGLAFGDSPIPIVQMERRRNESVRG